MCHISCKESEEQTQHSSVSFLLASNHLPSQVSNNWRLYRFLLLPCSPGREGNKRTGEKTVKHSLPIMANAISPLPFPTCRVDIEIRNRYFKGCIAPKDISHIRHPGDSKGNVLCVRGIYGLSFISYFKIGELSEYPELDEARLHGAELRSEMFPSPLSFGELRAIHCFFDNDRAGMEALRQIRVEYGRDLLCPCFADLQRMQGLERILTKQTERNRQVRSAKETHSRPPKRKTAFDLWPCNYIRFRSCGLSEELGLCLMTHSGHFSENPDQESDLLFGNSAYGLHLRTPLRKRTK